MDELRIPLSLLTPSIDVEALGFADTTELPPLEEPLGQARALEALDFGLNIKSHGFNIYASGPIGTGKWGIIHQRVQQVALSMPAPLDWCYVHNFLAPSSPICLSFASGKGREFKDAINHVIQSLRRDLPLAFESHKYLDARAKIVEDRDQKKEALFQVVNEEAQRRGFGFKENPVGFTMVPVRDGKPLRQKDREALTDNEKENISEQGKVLEGKIREFQAQVHALDHEAEHALLEMDQQVVRAVMQNRFAVLRDHHHDLPEVLEYLQKVEEDIVSNYKDFLPREGPQLAILGWDAKDHKPNLTRYEVNLLIEHPQQTGAPIIDEPHPTYANLIGKIERKSHMGVVYTDFTEIKAGSCMRASGGFLLVNVLDLLRQPLAWDALKRVIKTRSVNIEDPGEYFGFSTTGLKPQPIPVDIKIILFGPPYIFSLLQGYELDFPKLFKVKADFDVDIPRENSQEQLYARFIAQLCRKEKLPPFGVDAVGEIIRYSLRLAERRDRLSLRMSWISDIVREAAYWAKQDGRSLVSKLHVETAIEKKRHRTNLLEEKIQDEIQEGTLMVDLDGETVGQVNGLSIHHLGDYMFGRPCRITARTFVGNEGVIDIQREAELAGEIHSKGVMTLAGFLGGKFAEFQPFALSATLTFEQTYSEVEGDSAAVAELVAIISSLANIPVHQSLAVTGSINQLGEIQPIGGVNEKIEGFFECCQKRGLSGKQGVLIPAKNIRHLTLNPKVVEAAESGKFSIFGVTNIEEVLELLTGMPAGEMQPDGQYPPNTIFGRAAQRLTEMAKIAAEWSGHSLKENADGSKPLLPKPVK
jgi:lon-related putative ATP-dependent protease